MGMLLGGIEDSRRVVVMITMMTDGARRQGALGPRR